MRDDYTEWERFSHPDPDEEDPPTLDEVQTLREFAESFGTANAIAAEDAARQLMSLVDEGRVVEKRQNNVVDKGERVSWLLWDAAIDMPRYQPAILKLIEAIRALPQLERTEEQIRTGCFEDRLETWRSLEAFDYIWSETYSREWPFFVSSPARYRPTLCSRFLCSPRHNGLKFLRYPPARPPALHRVPPRQLISCHEVWALY
jgi:hypothetical protein